MFDVYVDGATATSPGALLELAEAMAARYGLAAAELQARLVRGRFRVKSEVDRATAELYLRDLAAIGARVRIEPAGARQARAAAGSPGAASSVAARTVLPPPAEPRPVRTALPPPAEPRPVRTALPPPPGPRPPATALPAPEARPAAPALPPTGGLRPALGALDGGGALSLATLDDEPAPAAPTDGTLPASMGPAALHSPRPVRVRSEPLDPFAPPGLAGAEPLLELADDAFAHRARTQASPSSAPAAEATPPGDIAPRTPGGTTPAPPAGGLAARIPVLASPRARLATGVVLAIVLGFVPAHLVAGWRERSAFGAIDSKVAAVQAAADTPDRYDALDAFRAEQLDAKRSARRAIALTSLLIWAAAGGALAHVWFRGVPWQRRAG